MPGVLLQGFASDVCLSPERFLGPCRELWKWNVLHSPPSGGAAGFRMARARWRWTAGDFAAGVLQDLPGSPWGASPCCTPAADLQEPQHGVPSRRRRPRSAADLRVCPCVPRRSCRRPRRQLTPFPTPGTLSLARETGLHSAAGIVRPRGGCSSAAAICEMPVDLLCRVPSCHTSASRARGPAHCGRGPTTGSGHARGRSAAGTHRGNRASGLVAAVGARGGEGFAWPPLRQSVV